MFQTLDESTADQLWRNALKWFGPNGIANLKPSQSGDTCEVLHAGLSIADPRQRWIPSRFPAISPAFSIAEVIWILRGRNDSKFLNFFNPILPKYQGTGSTFHGAYGFRLRKHFGHDQLQDAFHALQSDPDSRQVVLQIWDPASDLPHANGQPKNRDIPCNIVSALKVDQGKLEWTQIMRSNDLFRGLPYNIVQFTTLQEVIAGWLDLDLGSYNHISDSLHLYLTDGPSEKMEDSTDTPLNRDDLRLPKEDSDRVFESLSNFGDLLIDRQTSAATIQERLSSIELPQAYLNLAAVLSADAIRRRQQPEFAIEISDLCSNSCLKELYLRWHDRIESNTKQSTQNSA